MKTPHAPASAPCATAALTFVWSVSISMGSAACLPLVALARTPGAGSSCSATAANAASTTCVACSSACRHLACSSSSASVAPLPGSVERRMRRLSERWWWWWWWRCVVVGAPWSKPLMARWERGAWSRWLRRQAHWYAASRPWKWSQPLREGQAGGIAVQQSGDEPRCVRRTRSPAHRPCRECACISHQWDGPVACSCQAAWKRRSSKAQAHAGAHAAPECLRPSITGQDDPLTAHLSMSMASPSRCPILRCTATKGLSRLPSSLSCSALVAAMSAGLGWNSALSRQCAAQLTRLNCGERCAGDGAIVRPGLVPDAVKAPEGRRAHRGDCLWHLGVQARAEGQRIGAAQGAAESKAWDGSALVAHGARQSTRVGWQCAGAAHTHTNARPRPRLL